MRYPSAAHDRRSRRCRCKCGRLIYLVVCAVPPPSVQVLRSSNNQDDVLHAQLWGASLRTALYPSWHFSAVCARPVC